MFVRPEKVGELKESDAQKLQFSIKQSDGGKKLVIENYEIWPLVIRPHRIPFSAITGNRDRLAWFWPKPHYVVFISVSIH